MNRVGVSMNPAPIMNRERSGRGGRPGALGDRRRQPVSVSMLIIRPSAAPVAAMYSSSRAAALRLTAPRTIGVQPSSTPGAPSACRAQA